MGKFICKVKELCRTDDSAIQGRPLLFSNKALRLLIIPLIIEQMLTMMVGLADTMMVSQAGEAAISGVSLVDMLNGFFIFVFNALATGGAVVVSQYIGSKDKKSGCTTASQLVTISALISILFMLVGLLFHRQILALLFGNVEKNVMEACITYFLISAFSYPFIASYSACTALFRSMGNSKITLIVSIIMNVINVVGNAIGVFVLNAGIMGVAVSSLIARAVAAIIMIILTHNEKNSVYIHVKEIFSIKFDYIRKILKIAVPNGIESGLFQLSKIVLISVIAMFGTAQIAANGVANSIDYVGSIIVLAMGLAIVTVVGRCVGANDYEQAQYYIRKLTKVTIFSSLILDILIVVCMPLILNLYAISPEAKEITFMLVLIHNFFIVTVQPFSGPLSSALRAAGDVRYTMFVAIFATVICRVVFSLLFGVWLNMGIIGIWIAMGLDWTIRAIMFGVRYRKGKWKKFRMI